MAEVEVVADPYVKYRPATKTQTFDSAALVLNAGQNLAQLLQQKSTIAVREYGAGQLSTVSFRGTGSSHTAVLWNGLNINSPTLGMTDFSEVPLVALDRVDVSFGNGSVVYGSDALGGTINLSTNSSRWQQGYGTSVRALAGSFGRYELGGKLRWATKNIQLSLSPYFREAENDFPFINTNSTKRPELVNRNSAYRQQGGVLSIGLRTSGRELLQLNVWGQQGYRQTQPTIQETRYTTRPLPDATTKFLRTNLAYTATQAKAEYGTQLGYLYEQSRQYGLYQSRQLITKGYYSYVVNPRAEFTVGGELNRRQAENINYTAGEIWSSVYGHAFFQASEAINVAASLRHSAIFNQTSAWVPSVEAKYNIKALKVVATAKASRHFRFPSLNDRYWPELGVADLKPERGWQAESGLQWLVNQGSEISVRTYIMNIDNWILWSPDQAGDWRPNNLQNVVSKGIELEVGYRLNPLNLSGQFAYTRAINTKIVPGVIPELNQQLPYTPKYKATLNAGYQVMKNTLLTLSGEYTGRRYTTSVENSTYSLPHFYLFHLNAQHTLPLSRHNVAISGRANNILNHQYQSYGAFAMPGRSYSLTVIYSFNPI
jgi:iron complex outermembrane receptor protein